MTDPFTPSPELAAVATRWLRTYAARQSAAAARLFSTSNAATFIGSDAHELMTGAELHEMFQTYTDHQARLELEDMQAHGFEAGSFGWAYVTFTVFSPEAQMRVRTRTTMVFTLEDAVWRVVHVHNSNPKPNLESMGYETRSLEDLAALAQRDKIDIGQTGIASVMFTDIVDSTALAAATGDTVWNRVVRDHMARVAQQVAAAGGTLVKSLGDGTLSTYPSAGAAMRAAIAMQQAEAACPDEPRLRIRIGIHTGDVVQSDGDFIGSVVNKAARVAGAAAPDEIRVSDATRIMVGSAPGFSFSDPAHVLLKGLEGEHLLHALEWRQ